MFNLVVFRTDASKKIGLGHVLRCITLAEELRNNGKRVEFITRDHSNNLNNYIRAKGFKVHLLPKPPKEQFKKKLFGYENWLGIGQITDANETKQLLLRKTPEWIIIDHYALDKDWEMRIKDCTKNIMVIDDMANREHFCNVLLDQTFGRDKLEYKQLVPKNCKLLLGSDNSLLRPEFKALRSKAIKHRKQHDFIRNILISMGGIDEENFTLKVLDIISLLEWEELPIITVVLTSKAPYLQEIYDNLHKYYFPIQVMIDVDNMAELMLKSDLAIGAGGVTSWERCCLALPTLLIVLAENQQKVAENLDKFGAVKMIKKDSKMKSNIINFIKELMMDKNAYLNMCDNAAKVCDGDGVYRTVKQMFLMDTVNNNDF